MARAQARDAHRRGPDACIGQPRHDPAQKTDRAHLQASRGVRPPGPPACQSACPHPSAAPLPRPSPRHVAAHPTDVAREMRIRRPAALADMPSSRAATNRPHNAVKYGLPMNADPLHGSQSEPEIKPDGKPIDSGWSRTALQVQHNAYAMPMHFPASRSGLPHNLPFWRASVRTCFGPVLPERPMPDRLPGPQWPQEMSLL